jgi:hypothetical protein
VKDTEKLIWNARPGAREPLFCYERAARREWRTLWLRRWAWRRLAPGTAEYRSAMFTALRVYSLHRARLGLPPLGQAALPLNAETAENAQRPQR